MKLTIEIEQEDDANPTVKVAVDGKTIGFIQRIEFEARADRLRPKALIRFPDPNKTSVKVIGGDDKALESLKANLAYYRKLLSNFPWVDVP